MAWKPRCSQLGYYMQCSYRAAFDRALSEGICDMPGEVLAQVEERKKSSPNADLGTCIHYHLQAGVGAKFPGPTTDYAPEAEQELNASALFKNDLGRLAEAVRASATLAAKHLPALSPGIKWLAEVFVKCRDYTGHIDFLSTDLAIMVDLKTTSKPPIHPYIKPAHLVQVLAYVDAIEEKAGRPKIPVVNRGIVLYVDSVNASWVMPIEVDLTDPAIIEYRKSVREFAHTCASKKLYTIAHPSIGSVCEEWCPYTVVCRDRYKGGKGEAIRAGGPPPMKKGPLL